MRHLSTVRYFLGIVLVTSLSASLLLAQPPGPGKDKGPKGPKGPPPDAETVVVQGKVKEFTTAPKGEVDGLILTDKTVIHWPPHLADRFSDSVSKGDKIKVSGFKATGPERDTKIEVATLTNLRTNKTVENDDQPAGPPPGPGPGRLAPPPGRGDGPEERIRNLEKQVEELQKEVRRLRRDK
jgi:hypothetical protein